MALLPEFVNGNYDPMAQQRNMASLFQERATNVQTELTNSRRNFLADQQLPETLTATDVATATNRANLEALPQKLEIEASERDRIQRFQLLAEMKRVLNDPTLGLDPDDQDALIARGIEKTGQSMKPKDLKGIASSQGREVTVRNERLMEMYRNSRSDFEFQLDKAIEAAGMQPKDVAATALERMKGQNTAENTLLAGHYAPSTGSGSSDLTKPWKIALGQVNAKVKEKENAINKEALNSGLIILLDQAGNPQSVTDQEGKPLTTGAQASAYEQIYTKYSKIYDPEIKALQTGADTQAPPGYVNARDQRKAPATQPQGPQPAAHIQRWGKDANGRPIPIQ